MTEQQQYRVVRELGPDIELRQYEPCTLAEITVRGSAEQAANRGFGPLVTYISAKRLAMTAPVLQEPGSDASEWQVAFVLPGGRQPSDYPLPDDARVTLRESPAHLAASARWSGRWTERGLAEHTQELMDAVRRAGMRPRGAPRWARYDPPWKPPFLRRNEVIVEVEPSIG